MVYDGSYIRLYVNGVQVGAPTAQTGALGGSGSLIIGADSNGGLPPTADWLDGMTANIQVYNTSLSASEIQGMYQEGIGGAPAVLQNLVAWWPLNGDIDDYGGNKGHTGQNNGVTFTNTWTGGYALR